MTESFKLTQRTGLVLEGGGFRAIFTAAVLELFHQNNIFFPYVVGVSAGGAYGVSYVTRQQGRNLATSCYVSDKRYCGVKHLIRSGNYFNWDFVYQQIPMELLPLDYDALRNSATHFQVAVTNCQTACAEYFDVTGPLASPERLCKLLTATSSLPFISKMKVIDNSKYLDGGLVDAIPFDHALRMNNSRAVVVLTRPKGYVKEQSKSDSLFGAVYRKYPTLVKVMNERADSYNKKLKQIEQLEAQGQLFVIRPREAIPVGRMQNNPQLLANVYFEVMNEIAEDVDKLKRWLT
ncbi:MAG: patatin family protein [Cytophagaceae bacterium]|jgi:predicted patatin/cPLA2 family phospholipase|nr:patatin family protein [Cytophagaceae bacterium]